MARLYYYLLENFGPAETFAFLYNVCPIARRPRLLT